LLNQSAWNKPAISKDELQASKGRSITLLPPANTLVKKGAPKEKLLAMLKPDFRSTD
jgi:hypothetical protein